MFQGRSPSPTSVDQNAESSAEGKPSRTVDARKTRRALKALQRAVEAAEQTQAGLSTWEAAFAQSVEERLETYGSAFVDPAKGALDEPLSALQAAKVREIARAARKAQRANRAKDTDPTAALSTEGLDLDEAMDTGLRLNPRAKSGKSRLARQSKHKGEKLKGGFGKKAGAAKRASRKAAAPRVRQVDEAWADAPHEEAQQNLADRQNMAPKPPRAQASPRASAGRDTSPPSRPCGPSFTVIAGGKGRGV